MQKKKRSGPLPNKHLKEQRELKGLTQEELAEMVGASPTTVSRWESGLQPSPYYRRKLCEVFEKSPQELGFILSKDNVGASSNNDETTASEEYDSSEATKEQIPVLWPFTIPNELYYFLPGREQELNRLLSALQSSQSSPIIVIDGLGGLGKTSLAVELARRAIDQNLFEGIVGDSAQQEFYTGGEIVQLQEAVLDYDRLLNSIALQLGRWELATLKPEEKQASLARLMRQHRYLVLVDNLETAENAAVLVTHLRSLLGQGKAIITSRKQVQHDFANTLSLRGLDLEDSLIFLQQDLQRYDDHPLRQTSREKIAEIYEVTEGAPLAMKLVVAQARFLDLDLVLRQLRRAGSNLYTYLFRRSWEQISPTAQRVLIYIGQTVVTTVGWEELAGVGIAENEEQLICAIDQLIAYSLLNVSSTTHQTRYGIHQLTRQFVTSELPRLWQEQGPL